MIELQKMQFTAFKGSKKQQQQIFEQMIEGKRKDDAAEKEKEDSFLCN